MKVAWLLEVNEYGDTLFCKQFKDGRQGWRDSSLEYALYFKHHVNYDVFKVKKRIPWEFFR